MQKRTINILYWTATGLTALFLLPGIFFINDPMAIEGSRSLGIPYWLHMEIGIGKFIGAWLLILPFVPRWLKTWAYVGLGIDFLSAFIGHASVNGITSNAFLPLLMFCILLLSYFGFIKRKALSQTEPGKTFQGAFA